MALKQGADRQLRHVLVGQAKGGGGMLLLRRLFVVVVSLSLTACDLDSIFEAPSGDRPDRPLPQVARIFARPATEAECTCKRVEATTAYSVLENLNPSRSTLAWYQVTTRDLQTDAPINVSEVIQAVPDLAPGERRDLGCTVTPDQAVTASTPLARLTAVCRIRNEYVLKGSQLSDRAMFSEEVASYDKSKATGAGYCRAQCESGQNPNCLDLGNRHSRVAAPLMALLDAANTQGRDSVSVAEIYKSMGVRPGETKCKRGDLEITANTVVNRGDTRCSIDRSSIAALSSDLPVQDKLALLWGPFDAHVEIDKTLRMTRVPSLEPGAKGFTGEFRDAEEAIYISFQKSPLAMQYGPEIEKLNQYFGGYVRDLSYGKRTGGGRILIMSTPRGCIRMDAPA
jgi:hypothetical protein